MGGFAKPVPIYRQSEFVPIEAVPFKPEPIENYWRRMWFGELVFRLPISGADGRYVPSVKRIQEICAKFFNIKVEDLVGRGRDVEICEARDIAIHLCREVGGRSYTEIARRFNRDHSSVMSACKRLKLRVNKDPVLASRLNDARMRL